MTPRTRRRGQTSRACTDDRHELCHRCACVCHDNDHGGGAVVPALLPDRPPPGHLKAAIDEPTGDPALTAGGAV